MQPTPDGENFGGWLLIDGGNVIHVSPISDLRPHEVSENCWCHPDSDDDGFLVHNALDGREAYERQEIRRH